MFTTLRKTLDLIGAQRRRRFALIGILSVFVTALEAMSAVLILVIMRFVLQPDQTPSLPIIGSAERWMPGLSHAQVLTRVAILFGAFFVLRGIAFTTQQYVVSRVAENTGVVLADRLFDGYLTMPYEFHLHRNSSELIRNAYGNVGQLVGGVFVPLGTLLADILLTVGMLVVLLTVSAVGTLVAALLMGLLIWTTLAFVHPRVRRLGRQHHEAAKAAIQHLQQGLQGLRDVKVLGKERSFSQSFSHVRLEMAKAQYTQATLSSLPRPLLETAFMLVVLGAVTWAAAANQVDTVLATVGVFAYAGLRLQPSLQRIAGGVTSLRYNEALVDTLQADLTLLDASRADRDKSDEDPEPIPFDDSIRLEAVSFDYTGVAVSALSGIDLEIKKGESIGIAGQTGCGKTTLLDLLCGLLTPTAGRITVDGIDIAHHLRAWQRNIGVVHQSSFLIDDNLRNNIALGVPEEEIDHAALREAIEAAQLADVLDSLPDGLDTVVGERGVRLSGGQRQRVAIARALYRRPALLILDEGTSALDHRTESRVMQAIHTMDATMTQIMVAHRLSTIRRCDRIILLKDGQVVGVGTYDDLLAASPEFVALSEGTPPQAD